MAMGFACNVDVSYLVGCGQHADLPLLLTLGNHHDFPFLPLFHFPVVLQFARLDGDRKTTPVQSNSATSICLVHQQCFKQPHRCEEVVKVNMMSLLVVVLGQGSDNTGA